MTPQVIILAAGRSKRMKSKMSKALHPLCGQRVVDYVLSLAKKIQATQTVVVASPDTAQASWPSHTKSVIQDPPKGTGDAVRRAFPLLEGKDDVLVLFGDTPLITKDTVVRMMAAQAEGVAITVLGMRPPNPTGYGRLIEDEKGNLQAIIEHRDLPPEKHSEYYCNSGVMLIKRQVLMDFLDKLSPNNAQEEYYLTDLVGLAVEAGLTCRAVEGDYEELVGIDDRHDLACAANILQSRWRHQALEQGVTLIDPEATYFSFDTLLDRDVTIHPHVILGPGVQIEEGAEILPFCYLTQTKVSADCVVGPFAHLRGGTTLEAGAQAGNFVEMKNTMMKAGSKAKHLSYLGNAVIGEKANIGAGTITCNYDGFTKFKTEVGPEAFVGTNCSLIAPVHIGKGAMVGAGSVITKDVKEDELAVARPAQKNIPRGAQNFRQKRSN